MSSHSTKSVIQLQQRLGYTFRDAALLERALTHPSLLPERPDAAESNQRLEFLGDAVLQLFLTEELYSGYPEEREGLLSKRRASLANRSFLALLAREIGLDQCLLLGAGEEASGGREKDSALGDAFEALLGAVHTDSDYATARRVIQTIYGPLEYRLAGHLESDNPKGRLQEHIQPKLGNNALTYEVLSTEGPPHERNYLVEVRLNGQAIGSGRGTSKKAAEEAAAREALGSLKRG